MTTNDAPPAATTIARILESALLDPSSLRKRDAKTLVRALHEGAERRELALGAIAALLYSRSELADVALVERVLVAAESCRSEEERRASGRVVSVIATGRFASAVWAHACNRLRSVAADGAEAEPLLTLVGEVVAWRPEIAGIEDVVDLLEAPGLTEKRSALIDRLLVPLVAHAPEAFTLDRLVRIAAACDTLPRLDDVLAVLAARPDTPAAARAFADRESANRMPHREAAGRIVRDRVRSIVVVLNAGMGQGDDVVRLAPLLQGFLAASPRCRITVVTRRPYLWDHPRIRTVPIHDAAAIAEALAGEIDALVEYRQPEWPGFTYSAEAIAALERRGVERPPVLAIAGDLGRATAELPGGRLPFLHQRVSLAGREIASERGLDRASDRNVYDPGLRLRIELGLPLDLGAHGSHHGSALTGTPSPEAARVWRELLGDRDPIERPVALTNPFGGSSATKGFVDQDTLVAAEISGLVDEGFDVVLLPNGQPWGRRDAALRCVALVGDSRRARIRVAPDPGEEDATKRLELHERSDLAYGDRVMRLFKYFAAYADEIVTTEGWLVHFGYALGRPLRIFLAAGPFGAEYVPPLRAPSQRLVATFSPLALPAHVRSALFGEGDSPPHPHRPRKLLLEPAFEALGRAESRRAVPILCKALTSPDRDLRTWSAEALARCRDPVSEARLVVALADPSSSVVRAAARALLHREADLRRELGARYRELLHAHVEIASQNWEAVARVGTAAIPALFRAATSDVYDVGHGAKQLLREMLGPYVFREDPTASSAR